MFVALGLVYYEFLSMSFTPLLSFRQHFPLITEQGKPEKNGSVLYFDNGATTQKPQAVIDAHQRYYQEYNANVHRASHQLSARATTAFERARTQVKNFINAQSIKEVIWTKGTTESINIVTQSLMRNLLKPGDEIVLSVCEHHANIVPWQIVAKQTGAVIKTLSINEQGHIDLHNLEQVITKQTKVVACSHISNVLGRINPIEKIITKAKSVDAITLIDGAQAIAHLPIDVQALDCDFYVFSAHKMYGPTGVGVLYGKQALLNKMIPYQGGGEMIKKVSFHSETTFNELPFKLEAGTPNIAGVIAFSEAIRFLQPYVHGKEMKAYEHNLTAYCYKSLAEVAEISFIVEGLPDIGLISFTVEGHHNHDVATALDSYGIAVRSGHHCAMPLMEYLRLTGCIRVSLAPYNTVEEIDYFVECLIKILANQSQSPQRIDTLAQVSVESEEKQSSTRTVNSNDEIDLLVERFKSVKGWDGKHREIMMLGKRLPRLARDKRDDQSLITGCESLAWLVVAKESSGEYYFSADSDAKIIRGLLMIVLTAFNGKTAEEIQAFDMAEVFNKMGLMNHLSPSRGNGLIAIVNKINALIGD